MLFRSEFLKNAEYLIGLDLTWSDRDNFKSELILQSLSSNKSIKIFKFKKMYLSTFLPDLINFISSNQNITILILYDCEIKINLEFIQACSKSKSLKYLVLSMNEINEEAASKLSELNLKGINVDSTRISESAESKISQNIPKIENDLDLIDYKQYLE